MVRIEPVASGGGCSGSGSPPPASPSSCSSWPHPNFLPNTFPYPPQEAAFAFQAPVSWPASYYPPVNPAPFGPGFGLGYGYGYQYGFQAPYYGGYGYVAYNLSYQPQPCFQPPMAPPSPQEFNGVGSGRASGPRGGGGCGLKKGTTTLMIRNIPTRLRRDELMNLLDEHCREQNKLLASRASAKHQAAYDFVYLPFDFIKRGNLGYAFVNFTTARAAFKFYMCWSGMRWVNFYQCSKICAITRAHIQGKEASKRHLERCQFFCDTEEFLPVEISPPRNGYNAVATMVTTFGVQVPCYEKVRLLRRKKV